MPIGPGGPGAASGSLNAGRTDIRSTYQSATEETAIRAGDGGFQVSVAGKTDLVGGQITSTRDLRNSASFETSSVSVGLGVGTPKPGASLSAGLSGVGIG